VKPVRNLTDHVARQPGDLGVLRGVDGGYSEEARTRGFVSPALAGFTFLGAIIPLIDSESILGCT